MVNPLWTKTGGVRWVVRSLLVICVLLSVDIFTFTNAGPNPALGGLPHLYPKQPVFDCSSITGDDMCTRCVAQPTCGFCYDSLIIDPSNPSKQLMNGLCANYGDVKFTQGCPSKNRFYVSGQCAWPYNQRCILDSLGRCVIDYMYDDTLADTSKLSLAKGWYIGVLVFFAGLYLISFSYHFSPFYAKTNSDGFSDCEGLYLMGYVVTFALQLSALAVNMYSWNNNEDNYYTYGLYGYYISSDKYNMHMYSCSDYNTNPGANEMYCKVLPAAVITAAVGAYVSIVWSFIRLILAMTICCTDQDSPTWPPYDILLWRIDFLAAIGSWINTLVWTSAHLIIKETYITPPTGAPHDTLHIGKSWILSIVISFVHLCVVWIYAAEINRTSAPYDWEDPREADRAKERERELENTRKERGNNDFNATSLKISGPVSVDVIPAAPAVQDKPAHVLTPIERENEEIEMAIAASLADKKPNTGGTGATIVHHHPDHQHVPGGHDDHSSDDDENGDYLHNMKPHEILGPDGKPISKQQQRNAAAAALRKKHLAEIVQHNDNNGSDPGPDPALAYANDPAVIYAAQQQQQQQQQQYGGAVQPTYASLPAAGVAYDSPLVPAGAAVSPQVYSSVEASALPLTPVAPVVNFQISQAYHDAHDMHYGAGSVGSGSGGMSLSSGYVPGALLNQNNPYGSPNVVAPPAPTAPNAPPIPATPSAPNGQTDDAPPPYED